MNVLDNLKNSTVIDIKNYCKNNCINAVAMIHVNGDFNLSTLIRNANFFGFKEVCYVGHKKWDRRGSVGTHHYTDLLYFKNEEFFVDYINSKEYTLICIENNIPEYKHKIVELDELDFLHDIENPMFVFGEESNGLNDFMLDACKCIITIPSYGSVRSLNVGTTSGIIMSQYRLAINSNIYDKSPNKFI